MKHRVAILFDNFGPYHLARLRSAAEICDLLAVEFGASSDEYAWRRETSGEFSTITLNPAGTASKMSAASFRKALGEALGAFRPEVVFVPGWGSRGALQSLQWCLDHRIPAVVMSESTQWDAPRSRVAEWVKGRILSCFSSALAGGTSHVSYLKQLGVSARGIFTGYDAVDNAYFGLDAHRPRPTPMDGGRFLASARFVSKKNLFLLLSAYAMYRSRALMEGKVPWGLVLLGDGPLRSELERFSTESGLQRSLIMPGFVQYPDLPRWYAEASCFVHASLIEPWGLVVNEAMAAGLPVIVSRTCGCAADLVREGVNGWTFDPTDKLGLAELMRRIATSPEQLKSMGESSRRIIRDWGTERFAAGVLAATESALGKGVESVDPLTSALLTFSRCREELFRKFR
jgi:glycosyltransferase involved in cell wall biosynthesis